MGFSRAWSLGFCVLTLWLISAFGQNRPVALGPDAPAGQFSAARAEDDLAHLLGRELPHPVGSVENGAVLGRLLAQLAHLGVKARTLSTMSCRAEPGAIACGTVHDVITEATPGRGKAILLVAHFDSVAAGPGASDDMSGVAAIFETLRALKSDASGGHPVIALLSDGEETGLLGATAFLRDGDAAKVGLVINAEARGTTGPSYLFQTSAGDANLVAIYNRSVSHYAASSLYKEIYKHLPNDTDLTAFLEAGLPGYNFAFIGNEAAYHTALDRRAALDARSLQQQGDNLLDLTRTLQGTDFTALRSGDAVYLDILGFWLPRLSQVLAPPLSVAAFVLIVLAGWGGKVRWRTFLVPPALVFGAIALGFVLHGLAVFVSGHDDPSFAHPLALRLALGLGVFGLALVAMPFTGPMACWLWLAGLGAVLAELAPGVSPYFLFPALFAAPLLLAARHGRARNFVLFIVGLAGALIWIGLAAGTEAVTGLVAHPLFTVCIAFGFVALLPAWEGAAAPRTAIACLTLSLALAVIAGLLPAYDKRAPERLNLGYVEEDGKAYWLTDSVAPLTPSLRATFAFSTTPQTFWQRGFAAAAGAAQFAPPTVRLGEASGDVTLDLHASAKADGMLLAFPAAAHVAAVVLGSLVMPAPREGFVLACSTPDCARLRLALRGGGPFVLHFAEMHYGIPPNAAALRNGRPSYAVPSQFGDRSFIAAHVLVP